VEDAVVSEAIRALGIVRLASRNRGQQCLTALIAMIKNPVGS